MKLGLARHFQIPHARFTLVDGSGFDTWAKWYDATEVSSRAVPLAGDSFDKCYCSDLPRAVYTANYLFKGPIEKTSLLQEVPFSGFLPRRLKLPLLVWQATSRMGWYLDHEKQTENRTQTLGRIAEFISMLASRHGKGERILIVSHGFYMQFLEKKLVQAGFRGQVPVRPLGGIIYPFERD